MAGLIGGRPGKYIGRGSRPGRLSGVPAGDISIDIDGATVDTAHVERLIATRRGGAAARFSCSPAKGVSFIVDGTGMSDAGGNGREGSLSGSLTLAVSIATPAVQSFLSVDGTGMRAAGGDGDKIRFWGA